jgi:hypothetical protein
VAAERGLVAGTVGRDPESLVDQPLVPHPLQRPPHRLDVVAGQRPVRVLVVLPERHPVGHLQPRVHVLVHAGPAQLVELLDPELLDLLLAGDAERLLDLELDREPVRVPARLALDVAALHGLVAADDVLERASQHMVDAGPAVRGGRALVEHEAGRALAVGEALPERVLLAPEACDVLLHPRELRPRVHVLKGFLLCLHACRPSVRRPVLAGTSCALQPAVPPSFAAGAAGGSPHRALLGGPARE